MTDPHKKATCGEQEIYKISSHIYKEVINTTSVGQWHSEHIEILLTLVPLLSNAPFFVIKSWMAGTGQEIDKYVPRKGARERRKQRGRTENY